MSNTTIYEQDGITIVLPTELDLSAQLTEHMRAEISDVIEQYNIDIGDIAVGIGGAVAALLASTTVPLAVAIGAIATVATSLNEFFDGRDLQRTDAENQEAFNRSSPNRLPEVYAAAIAPLFTALADILAELQKIGICTCAEDKGGSGAGTGTGPAIPGVTRLSADASAFFPAEVEETLAANSELVSGALAAVDEVILKSSDKLSDAIGKQKQVIDDVLQSTAVDVAPIIQNLDDDLSQIFVNASRDGKITADEIGNAFQAMALRIIQTQVFDKLFAGAGPLGEIAGNLLGGLFGFAGGGTVQAGLPVIVGERGPELFIPPLPGRIANNQVSQQMLGGAGNRPLVVNNNFRFDTAVHNDMYAAIASAAPLIEQRTAVAVMNALKGIEYS
jgi:hypothetical protein